MSKRPEFIPDLPDDKTQPITVESAYTHILVFQWDDTGETEHCVATPQDKVLETVASLLDNYVKGQDVSHTQAEIVEFTRCVVKNAIKEDERAMNQGCVEWLQYSLDQVSGTLGKIGHHALKIVRDCLQ